MLSAGERPRELKWYHAGPMLFGDWGTSRLYVMGLAFAFNGRASFWFIAAMCVLMIGVGWAYTIICRLFPDGGGVYSAAKHRSQLIAVIGGLLLCADYVVTASLSCLDAFHYMGIKEETLVLPGGYGLDVILAALAILAIGALNVFGPKKTGTIAMVIALATVVLTLIIGVSALPHLKGAELAAPTGSWRQSWIGFTEIVLALSGVEAIANMTGIMVPPVERTARRSIVPVLIEIVILNLVLAAAMDTLPDSTLYVTDASGQVTLNAEGRPIPAHTSDMLRVIADQYVGPTFAALSSFVFAALLLSAVNTALGDLVSIQFMLSRDKELPRSFGGLNRFGMPALPLAVAAAVPALVLLLFPRVEALADLYAVGVVGAIAINLASTSTDPTQPLKRWERGLMIGLTLIMIAIEVTICVVKPHARDFALIMLALGLAARLGTIVTNKAAPLARSARVSYLSFAVASGVAVIAISFLIGEESPWLKSGLMAGVALLVGYASYQTQHHRAALIAAEAAGAPTAAPRMLFPGSYTAKERIMVATQGNPRLLDFALKECKSRQAELILLFLRHLAVTPMGPAPAPTLAEDIQASTLFDQMRTRCQEAGVPLRLLYGVARDIPDAILDLAVTHGADQVLLGTTRRGTLWRAMKGDVIQAVAEQLPENIALLIHA